MLAIVTLHRCQKLTWFTWFTWFTQFPIYNFYHKLQKLVSNFVLGNISQLIWPNIGLLHGSFQLFLIRRINKCSPVECSLLLTLHTVFRHQISSVWSWFLLAVPTSPVFICLGLSPHRPNDASLHLFRADSFFPTASWSCSQHQNQWWNMWSVKVGM